MLLKPNKQSTKKIHKGAHKNWVHFLQAKYICYPPGRQQRPTAKSKSIGLGKLSPNTSSVTVNELSTHVPL